MKSDKERWSSIEDAAEDLEISERTAWRWLKSGKLTKVKGENGDEFIALGDTDGDTDNDFNGTCDTVDMSRDMISNVSTDVSTDLSHNMLLGRRNQSIHKKGEKFKVASSSENSEKLLKWMSNLTIDIASRRGFTPTEIDIIVNGLNQEFSKISTLMINAMLSKEKLRLEWLVEIFPVILGPADSLHQVRRLLSTIPYPILNNTEECDNEEDKENIEEYKRLSKEERRYLMSTWKYGKNDYR